MKRFLGFICLLYVGIIIYVLVSNKLNSFIAPNMQIYIKLSIIPLFIMGILFILNKRIDYKFSISDLVLVLPLIMVIIAGDGNLSLNLAGNRMMGSNEERSKTDIVDKEINYDLSTIDFEIVEGNFTELSSYITFSPKALKYEGKTISLSGFSLVDDPTLPNGLYAIGRYYISCCAADATFTGFYIKVDDDIKNNTWYNIEGVLKHGKDNEGYDILYIDVVNINEVDKGEQYIYACYAYDDGLCSNLKKYNLEY